MAYAVLHAVATRLEREGRLHGPLPDSFTALGDEGPSTVGSAPLERPPLRAARAAA
jgi:hypothetical protein